MGRITTTGSVRRLVSNLVSGVEPRQRGRFGRGGERACDGSGRVGSKGRESAYLTCTTELDTRLARTLIAPAL